MHILGSLLAALQGCAHVLAAVITTHPNATIAVIVWLLTGITNGLLKYGHSERLFGLLGGLGKIVDWLSPFTRRDANGTFKLPFTFSRLVAEAGRVFLDDKLVGNTAPAAGQRGLVRLGVLLALAGAAIAAVLLLPGCTPAQATSWRQFGVTAAKKCAAKPVVGTVKAGVESLEKLAADESVSLKQVGQKLLADYGLEAALCVVTTAFDAWGGPQLDAGEIGRAHV
mgnify:FL=1